MTLTYVIADIHGRADLLEKGLHMIAKHAEKSGAAHKVIFLGDYIDRGPESARVLKIVKDATEANTSWVALLGNHEDMMISGMLDDDVSAGQCWLGNGGIATILSYADDADKSADMAAADAAWLRANAQLYHEDQRRVYVHAFAPEEYDLCDAPSHLLLWKRYPAKSGFGYRGKHVVHGHTPVNQPELYANRTNLDTGAVFGGPLSIGVFDDAVFGGPIEIMEASDD